MHKRPFPASQVSSDDLDRWFNVSGIFEQQCTMPDSNDTDQTAFISFALSDDSGHGSSE
jgi:hypothetical protein